jgi:hypothetical protein
VALSYGGDGFDFPDQKILIADLNMDIKTLRVSVRRAGDADFVYWKLLDTYSGSFVSDSSNLYSIERTSSGFVIKFQTTSSSSANLVGGDIVKFEYLSSNGSNANVSSVFTSITPQDGSTIVNNLPSFGGLDAPDLDEAKRIAPLVFSAQQRLVTKSDYYGFLAQLGYSTNVNVWGGEDNSPPMYGRVLFSISGITDNNTEIKNVISLIKERSIITVLPEYISPRAVGVSFKLNVQFNKDTVVSDPATTVELMKLKLEEAYSIGGYNNSLTVSAIKAVVESFDGYSVNSDIENDLKLFVLVAPSTVLSTLNFKNRIKQGATTNANGTGLFSSEFTSPYYTQGLVSIRDKPIKFPGTENPPLIGKLKLYTIDSDGQYLDLDAIVGDINYKTGVVTLIPNITSEVFTLNVNPNNPDKIIAKDEVYLSLDITTTKPLPI